MTRVMFVTTMWEILNNPEEGTMRESDIRDRFWNDLIDKGARIDRLQQGNETEAWRIIEAVIKGPEEKEGVPLREALVDLRMKPNEISKMLYTPLPRLLADQKAHLLDRLTRMETSEETDPKVREGLEMKYKGLEELFHQTVKELSKSDIPFFRGILSLLTEV